MTARETVLSALRVSARAGGAPPPYTPRAITDLRAQFVLKAKASYALVHEVRTRDDIPEVVFGLLASLNAVQRLHVPAQSALRQLPWQRTPALELSGDSPGGEGAALSQAAFGIAETGTLVFPAGTTRPSSWHFLPGRELVVVETRDLRASLEDAMAELVAAAGMPSTVNLVTGPSRTGDIEQTMERGAHGPREVHILLTG